MRNFIYILCFLISGFVLGQGKINIFNYTTYYLHNSLVGWNTNNTNCLPSFDGTNHPVPVPPYGSVIYNGYYNSGLQSPPIMTWTLRMPSGAVSVQPHNAPILNSPIATTTSWMINKFTLDDVNGNSVPNSGESIGTIGCNGPYIDYVGGPGSSNPYEAFWFVAAGETFFVIQP